MRFLDSNVLIDYLRGHRPATLLLDRITGTGDAIAASEISRFEILAGAREPEMDRIESVFSALIWAGVDQQITHRAAAFARSYRASHGGIDAADYLIAATALALDAELLTTNVRHFPMLEDLEPAY